MRTLSIFLLFLSNLSLLCAKKEIHFSFELLKGDSNYRSIMQKKADLLNIDGFDCAILEEADKLSLRCNDIYDIKELTSTMQKFKKKQINYTLLHLNKKNSQKSSRKLFPFYLGYTAYDRGAYEKAAHIFKLHYTKEDSLKHAKAYTLALFKQEAYLKALKVLSPYAENPETSKLYRSIVKTYLDTLIKQKRYADAHRLIIDTKLSTLEKKKLEYKINYKHSLMLSGEKNYKEANKLLAPYEKAYPKSKRLMIANMMALSSIEFYDNQEKGWEALKSNPKEALRYFSKNCETNATNECQEGMMYSYSKIGKPIQSTFLAKELYKKHQDDKYLKLLVRDYLRIKSIDKAQFYYTLLKDKRGIENPKEVQRVLLANRYLKEKNLKEAARAIKKISNQKLKAKFSTRLDILRKNSAKDRLLNYSRAKEYKKCSAFATKLIRSYGDKDIDRIGGWCAFNAKQYKEAEVFFERIVEKDAEDADLYALALNAEKSHNNTKAIESLERIKNPYQKPEQILSLYVDLDQTRNAKELLQEMKDSQERDSLIRKVNKSNKKESHIHQVVGGFSYYRNKGEKGENYLELTSMPLDIGYLSQDGRYY
ncbi:MAG: hypothetical protein Q9M39_08475 [Sulfurovum sp.]|nr:hypothetical protein [Sulfurovum sp.]